MKRKGRNLKHWELLFPSTVKPRCPRCGSDKVESRGDSWSCNECHRRWLKEIRPEVKERIERLKNEKMDRKTVKGKDKGNTWRNKNQRKMDKESRRGTSRLKDS